MRSSEKWFNDRKEEILFTTPRKHQAFLLESNLTFLSDQVYIAYLIDDKYKIYRGAEIIQHGHDSLYWFKQLEEDIYNDLIEMTKKAILKNCTIGFLPNIKGSAMVKKICQDEYAIAINMGMLYIIQLICQSIMLENNEYCTNNTPYEMFQSAQKLFQADTLQKFQEELNSYTASIGLGEQIEVAAITTLIMKFIVLHELGHIELGHADFLYDLYKNNKGITDIDQMDSWEFQADSFALDTILNNSSSNETKWNHAFWIYTFFLALDCMEFHIGEVICPKHPKPLLRARQIKSACLNELSQIELNKFNWIMCVFSLWKGCYMNTQIMVSIKTKHPEQVANIFAGDNFVNCDGFRMELRTVEPDLGFMDGDTVFEIAITFLDLVQEIGINTCADILGGYLLAKFFPNSDNPNRDNIVRVQNQLITDEEKLKQTIKEALTEKEDTNT